MYPARYAGWIFLFKAQQLLKATPVRLKVIVVRACLVYVLLLGFFVTTG